MHGWMEDRVCVVTDAAGPAGHALAVSLAKMDATVVAVVGNAAEGAAVRARIAAASGSARVETLEGSLATRDGVVELASDFLAAHDRLDVLVNNAQAPTIDGAFHLTTLLLDHVPRVGAKRVVNVVGAPEQRLDLEVFTYELARRTQGTPVTVNCVNARGGLWPSARRQAVGPLFLATSAAVEGVTGRYFVGMRETRSPAASFDRARARQLWNRWGQTSPAHAKVSEDFGRLTVAESL